MENHIQAFLESKGIDYQEYQDYLYNNTKQPLKGQNITKHLNFLIDVYCDVTGVTRSYINTRFNTRLECVVRCRQFICKHIIDNNKITLAEVGFRMPMVRKDHTTVRNSRIKCQNFIATDPKYRTLYGQFCERIEELKKK